MTATDESKPVGWWLFDAFAALILPFFVVALFIQCLGAYFTLGDSVPEPTQGDIAAYWITAGIALVIGLTGLGAAVVRGSGRAIVGYLAMGALVLPAILILAVPRIDFGAGRDQSPEPLGSNYCSRTDSENCPGG